MFQGFAPRRVNGWAFGPNALRRRRDGKRLEFHAKAQRREGRSMIENEFAMDVFDAANNQLPGLIRNPIEAMSLPGP